MEKFEANPYKSSDGRTCLHAAVSRGDADQLNYLLENLGHERAKLLKEMDRQGNTVLHLAVRRNRLDMIKRLVALEPELPSSPNRDNETAVYVAVRLGFLPVVQELLKCSPKSIEIASNKGKNILHLAVELSQDKILKFLVENVDLSQIINQPDEALKDCTQRQEDGNQSRGDSPLLIADINKNVYMVEASKDSTQGKDDENQSRGDTPLHIAARIKNEHMVTMLLKVPGLNKDAVNRDGLTPLDIAREHTEYDEPYKIIEKLCAYPLRGKPFLYNAPTMTLRKQKKAVEILDGVFADRRNVELVVATLMATMTFAAVFTVPGGLSSEGAPGGLPEGSPVLIGDYSFKLFLIFDCLAFFLSIFVVLMWEMNSPLTTRDKFVFMYLSNGAACAAFAFTTFSLTAAVHTLLAHKVKRAARIIVGSCMLIILMGVGVFLYMALRFSVRIARVHRLCGVPYIVDDIVEKCWVIAENHGLLDIARSCDHFLHRLIWGDLF